MYNTAALNAEIRRAVAALETHNGASVISKSWLTNAVLARHSGEMDAPFAAYCSRYAVTQGVDRYFRELRSAEESVVIGDQQDLLPGFERLQQRYLVKRGGEVSAVPIQQLSDDEIQAKADELRAMGDGLYKHADELVRFVDMRQAKAV